MKPFQTLPLVEDGVVAAFGFGDEEIALACASHGGTDSHVDVVTGMLNALEADQDSLHCGAHPPFDGDAAFRLRCSGHEPGRIHNNCSGKHAGFLALCAAIEEMAELEDAACATCHLDGGHDGRTWDFTGRGEGLRNTISLRGRSGTGHGPVHWSA